MLTVPAGHIPQDEHFRKVPAKNEWNGRTERKKQQ